MNKLQNNSSIVFKVFLTLIFIIYIIFDAIYHDELRFSNETQAVKIQMITSYSTMKFFSYYAELGEFLAIAIIVLLSFAISDQKAKIFFLVLLTSTTDSLNNTLKMIYHEPRPYMDFNTLKNINCSADYGKPSGHAMVSSVFYFTHFYFVFYEKVKTLAIWIQGICYLSIVSFVALIGYDRVVLGEHSYNQVILGYVYGLFIITILFIYSYNGETIFDKIYKYILKQTQSDENQNKIFPYIIFTAVYIIWIVNHVYLYTWYIDIEQNAENYNKITQNIQKQCGILKNYKKLISYNFLHSTNVSVVYAMMISLIYLQGKCNYEENKFYETIDKISLWKQILRIIILFTMTLLPYVVLQLISFSNLNIFVQYFFKYHLQGLLMGILFIVANYFVFKKLNIDVVGDFVQKRNRKISNDIEI